MAMSRKKMAMSRTKMAIPRKKTATSRKKIAMSREKTRCGQHSPAGWKMVTSLLGVKGAKSKAKGAAGTRAKKKSEPEGAEINVAGIIAEITNEATEQDPRRYKLNITDAEHGSTRQDDVHCLFCDETIS
ncbi:hypothetical protein MRB53_037068 [Persea americana]|nr:hypothetical protein MRB53_037068 [Persea americana]